MIENASGQPPDLESALKELRDEYISDWPSTKDKFSVLMDATGEEEGYLETLQGLRNEFHKLGGTGATYGFPAVTDTARATEKFVKALLEKGEKISPDEIDRIKESIAVLDEIFMSAGNPLPAQLAAPVPSLAFSSLADSTRKIAVIDTEAAHIERVRQPLHDKGYELLVWQERQDPLQFLHQGRPQIILMDTTIGELNGIDLCRKIKSDPIFFAVPVVFLSAQTGLKERLEALRSGGDAYFEKPISLEPFLEAIDLLGGHSSEIPMRVLSVEDDQNQIAFVRRVLEDVGYLFHACPDPKEMLKDLDEFNPDLLLMDVMLPGCTGFELARMVRQDNRYLALPIVFLTSVDLASGRGQALEASSDDYLVKPVDSRLLLNCIRSRTKRALLLRKLSDQDGLTRVLNRASLMRQLEGMVSRGKRYEERLSVALIDIDKFKGINDTYGHPAGDTILKNLADFFRQKLRDSDVFGRYGGEEFVILFPNIESDTATVVLDRLREEFVQKKHSLPDGNSISVTFSGGISSLQEHGTDSEGLLAAADAALYSSKEGGRNRISVASS